MGLEPPPPPNPLSKGEGETRSRDRHYPSSQLSTAGSSAEREVSLASGLQVIQQDQPNQNR